MPEFVITRENAGPKYFRFKRHKNRSVGSWDWIVYVCDALSRSALLTAGGRDLLTFPSVADARAHAELYAQNRGWEYLEYKAPPKPPPPTPEQEIERQRSSVYGRVRLSEQVAADHLRRGELLQAAESYLHAARRCAEAIELAPGKRLHLIRCAESRADRARELLQEWVEELRSKVPLRLAKSEVRHG